MPLAIVATTTPDPLDAGTTHTTPPALAPVVMPVTGVSLDVQQPSHGDQRASGTCALAVPAIRAPATSRHPEAAAKRRTERVVCISPPRSGTSVQGGTKALTG